MPQQVGSIDIDILKSVLAEQALTIIALQSQIRAMQAEIDAAKKPAEPAATAAPPATPAP